MPRRSSVRCGLLQGGKLTVTAYDLLQVLVDGNLAGQLWRAKPSTLELPTDVCADAAADVSISLLVSTYGRDNFYVSGTPEEMLKGIVGAVKLQAADKTSRQLSGWCAPHDAWCSRQLSRENSK